MSAQVDQTRNQEALTLSAAIEGFTITRLAEGYSQATLDVYNWALSRLLSYLNDPPITRITEDNLLSFFAYLRTAYFPPLAGSSIENAWKAVRSFYNWVEQAFNIARPDRKIPRPQYGAPEIVPFTLEEVKALLRACDYSAPAQSSRRKSFSMKRPTALRDRALVLLLLDTGLRASECCRLLVADVILQTGEIRVRPYGSGRKTRARTVYVQRTTRAALWKYLALRDNPVHLFATVRGSPLNRSSLYHLIEALGERAGVLSAHPHKFRHTFAIQYLRNGGDVFTLQRLLGHASLEMVRRYLALADSDAASVHRTASPVDNWF